MSRDLLSQVEVCLMFGPRLQTGGVKRPSDDTLAQASHHWLTLDVYGIPATSEVTGRPVLENMRLETDGEDIQSILPDSLVNQIADYVLNDN